VLDTRPRPVSCAEPISLTAPLWTQMPHSRPAATSAADAVTMRPLVSTLTLSPLATVPPSFHLTTRQASV